MPLVGQSKWSELMYKVSDDVRITHGQDGGVVLDVRQGQIFDLNPVASRIFELLKNGEDEGRIVEAISHAFNTSPDVVGIDVREFITILEKHGLLGDSA
jgi:hypothetical protein